MISDQVPLSALDIDISILDSHCNLSYFAPHLLHKKHIELKDINGILVNLRGVSDQTIIANILHIQIKSPFVKTDFKVEDIVDSMFYTEALKNWSQEMQGLIMKLNKKIYISDLYNLVNREIKIYDKNSKVNPLIKHKYTKLIYLRAFLKIRNENILNSIDFIGSDS